MVEEVRRRRCNSTRPSMWARTLGRSVGSRLLASPRPTMYFTGTSSAKGNVAATMAKACVELCRSMRTFRPSLRTWLNALHFPCPSLYGSSTARTASNGSAGGGGGARRHANIGPRKTAQSSGVMHMNSTNCISSSGWVRAETTAREKPRNKPMKPPACRPVTRPTRGGGSTTMKRGRLFKH